MAKKEKSLIKKIKDWVHERGGICHKEFIYPGFSEKGWPDLTIVLKNCPPIFVETKSPNQKPRANQLMQIARLNQAGALAFICDDFETFKLKIGEFYPLDITFDHI